MLPGFKTSRFKATKLHDFSASGFKAQRLEGYKVAGLQDFKPFMASMLQGFKACRLDGVKTSSPPGLMGLNAPGSQDSEFPNLERQGFTFRSPTPRVHNFTTARFRDLKPLTA